MEDKISTLGVNLKKIRESKGISGYKLAQMAHIGTSTISQIETGERQNINSSTLQKIAQALEVSPEDLLYKEGENEFIVNDLKEAILLVLSSDELTLDCVEVTSEEKKLMEKYLNKAISMIREQRRDLQ